MSPVPYKPEGYHTITPYLTVKGGAEAVAFYTNAFGARELPGRMEGEGGKVLHTELEIGDSRIMLADEFPEYAALSPLSLGGSPVRIHLYVEDVDAVAARAVEAGGRLLFPIEDQFYGDRSGRLQDPFGHIWLVSTHKEDVSPEEMRRRAEKLYSKP